MAQVTVAFRRLLLKGIRWDAEKKALSLADALKAACLGRYEENSSGQVMLQASGNGSSVTFALPQQASTLTPQSISDACSELDDLYNDCKAELIAGGTATPTEDEIYDEMLHNLVARRTSTTDRRGMCLA